MKLSVLSTEVYTSWPRKDCKFDITSPYLFTSDDRSSLFMITEWIPCTVCEKTGCFDTIPYLPCVMYVITSASEGGITCEMTDDSGYISSIAVADSH